MRIAHQGATTAKDSVTAHYTQKAANTHKTLKSLKKGLKLSQKRVRIATESLNETSSARSPCSIKFYANFLKRRLESTKPGASDEKLQAIRTRQKRKDSQAACAGGEGAAMKIGRRRKTPKGSPQEQRGPSGAAKMRSPAPAILGWDGRGLGASQAYPGSGTGPARVGLGSLLRGGVWSGE